MPYLIREVDGADEDHADDIAALHQQTFGASAPAVDPAEGHWWLAYCGRDTMPCAFAGLTPSTLGDGIGYLKRAGVLPGHTGQGLQMRMIRARIARARRNGWHRIVTDTTDNPRSANNLARAGFRMFAPDSPWGMPTTLYWTKDLRP